MILSKKFYDHCNPSYKKVIDKLEQDLADIDSADDAIAIKTQRVLLTIVKFSKSYLTPKEYWHHCLDIIERKNKDAPDFNTYKELCCGFIKLAYYHLCCVKEWNTLCFHGYHEITYLEPYADNYLKLDHFHCFHRTGGTERDLSYPHGKLKECLRQFEIKAVQTPSTKLLTRYEEMLQLYPEIKDAEYNDEEWYKLLLQVGDNAYVKNNVEYRLGQNLLNVKLWMVYIGFLKEHGEYNHLLEIYSKYCRLFLDDHEIKKEYEEAMIKYGPVNLPWENLFDFEAKNGEEEEDQTEDSEEEELSPFDKKICAVFYKTYKRQNFSLPGPLVLYILKNAGHRVLQKLFFSCKYFFATQPTPICYSLHTGPKEYYDSESLTLRRSPKEESFPKNLYITGNLFDGTQHVPIIDFLPKFYRCEAKYICLGSLNISFDDLKFLIGHGGVIELSVSYCTIKDENGEFIDIERIMTLLPNIESICLGRVKTNAKTGHELAAQKFKSKFVSINVHQILGVPFDLDEFMKFLIANRDEEQMFFGRFYFNEDFDAAFVEKFKQILNDYPKSKQFHYITAEFDDWE